MCNRVCKKSEIVSESEGVKVGLTGDEDQEGVVGYDEEEGGEGAPLFDSSFDVDPFC